MSNILFQKESYKLIGICMEVHNTLGMGFHEVVYKDALELEFASNGIEFKRETKFEIFYKGVKLPHFYHADFIVYDLIILEVKASSIIVNNFVRQTINYLKASDLQLGIIANFGQPSFVSQRIVF